MAQAFVEDPPYIKNAKAGVVDFTGFALLAVWLGTLQVILDKGQQEDWFSSHWITLLTAMAVVALTVFIIHELRSRAPVVRLRVFKVFHFQMETGATPMPYASANDHSAPGAERLQCAGHRLAEFRARHADEHRGRARGIQQRAEDVENGALAARGAKFPGGRDVFERRMKIRREEKREAVLAQRARRVRR